MVTHKMISDDINMIVSQLKEIDAKIPSLFNSIRLGLVAAAVIILIQLLSYTHAFIKGEAVSNTYLFSLLFSCGLGLIVLLATISGVSKFSSIPLEVRQKSVIFKICSKTCKKYLQIWLFINFLSLIIVNSLALDPFVTYGTQFLSMVILFIIYTIDLGRYDFSILHSAISAWRNGKLESVVLAK